MSILLLSDLGNVCHLFRSVPWRVDGLLQSLNLLTHPRHHVTQPFYRHPVAGKLACLSWAIGIADVTEMI
jgi:hypothetical protein